MQGRPLLALLAALTIPAAALCQRTPPAPDLRIRVSVDLDQIDVIVTGPWGEHVSDLSKDDFELFLDSHPQAITNFGYVTLPAPSPPDAPAAARHSPNQVAIPPAPPVRLRPEKVERPVALFVDDLSLSADSVPHVRNGLRKAIESGIGPGDLTAIIRASAGMGAVQDFTTDRQRLPAAAGQIRWYPGGRGEQTTSQRIKRPVEEGALASAASKAGGDREDARESNLPKGYFLQLTIDSLERVIAGMAALPGRKAVVVLSNDLTVAFREPGTIDTQPAMHVYEEDRRISDRLRQCVDTAARLRATQERRAAHAVAQKAASTWPARPAAS
jgi:VWFA-related protein